MENRYKNLSGHSWLQRRDCPTGSAQVGQIGLFGLAEESTAASGCPTAFQEPAQVEFLPERQADQGEEPGEAVVPASQPGTEAQEHVSCSPAVSTMAQRGRKDWRSRWTWHLAAALRRRCLAQSSEWAGEPDRILILHPKSGNSDRDPRPRFF